MLVSHHQFAEPGGKAVTRKNAGSRRSNRVPAEGRFTSGRVPAQVPVTRGIIHEPAREHAAGIVGDQVRLDDLSLRPGKPARGPERRPVEERIAAVKYGVSIGMAAPGCVGAGANSDWGMSRGLGNASRTPEPTPASGGPGNGLGDGVPAPARRRRRRRPCPRMVRAGGLRTVVLCQAHVGERQTDGAGQK